jgi:hypothetical protein
MPRLRPGTRGFALAKDETSLLTHSYLDLKPASLVSGPMGVAR